MMEVRRALAECHRHLDQVRAASSEEVPWTDTQALIKAVEEVAHAVQTLNNRLEQHFRGGNHDHPELVR